MLEIWRGWSRQQRLALVGGIVVVIAGGAVAAYLVLKRDSDKACPPPCELEAEPKAKPKPPKVKTVDWPVYGYDDARTRYFPTKRVGPPYDSADWSYVAGTLLEFSPVIHGDRLFIVDKNARVIALDSKAGKQKWATDVGGLSAASPAYADGRLFVVTLEPGDVQALDPRTGKVLWERDLGARSETSPAVFKDKVIVGNESGTVFALDVKTGNTRWSIDTADAVKGGVAINSGTAYFGNYAGEIYAVDADDGSVRWQSGTQGSSFGRTGSIYSTPAVAYGRVFVGSIDSRVYSLDADNGAVAWSQSTGDWVYSAPAVAEVGDAPPTVYIGSKDKYLYALDATTGDVRWKQFTGGILLGAPSVIGDIVYAGVIGPMNGTIGYDAETGEEVFTHELGEYNPAVTDGQRLYLTGEVGLRAFRPLSKQDLQRIEDRKKRQAEEKRKKEARQEARKAEGAAPGKGGKPAKG
ncbi:MAG: PQQ-binding-like beta-propeller repeat protein [Solirubrobacterales bacterium]